MKKSCLNNFFAITLTAIMLVGFSRFPVYSDTSLTGSVKEDEYIQQAKSGVIKDSATGKPIANAQIMVPSKGIIVQSDENGKFDFNIKLNGPTIIGIRADGYQPYSLTIDKNGTNSPLNIKIDKENGKQIVIDTKQHHLGDDNFSPYSANADDFRLSSGGMSFEKQFYVDNLPPNQPVYIKIGSIIGLDTQMARILKQNKISSYSSPTKIFINSKKIGELRINGDNQQIAIPRGLLMSNSYNKVEIETGSNQFAISKTDYDDMEFMNIVLELK